MQKTQVYYEATPNPQALKFYADQQISQEIVQFDKNANYKRSPLAQKLLGFPWADSVFIGHNFVTVTKQDWVGWDVIAEPLSQLIGEHLQNNEPVVFSDDGNKENEAASDDSADVVLIKNILNQEIRPAVAMDGGDIMFHKYENEVLYLRMQGSCSGCPSSTYTLKEGIEARLKERLPSLKEVVAI